MDASTSVGRKQTRTRRGFTLIEVMIVVLIIGVIASIAIPGFQRMTARARRSEMQIALQKMRVYFVNLYGSQGSFCPPDLGSGDCSNSTSFTSVLNPTAAVPIGQGAPWDPTRPGWVSLPFYPDGDVKLRYSFTANGSTLTLTAYGAFPGLVPIGSVSAPPQSYNFIYSETYTGTTLTSSLETPSL